MERRMSDLFETEGITTRRKATGSSFRISHVPLEFSDHNCVYENPIYGLEIGFAAIFVYETFPLKQKQYDRIIQQPVCTAVVLEKGRLKKVLEQKLAPNFPVSAANDVIADLYGLIVEWLNSDLTQYYHFNKSEVPIHIYETETRQFNDAMWNVPPNVRLGSEIIEKTQATLVF
jgi:hypothetical protein